MPNITTSRRCDIDAQQVSSGSKLVYGAKADGTIMHISDVLSGAGCECWCPGCGEPLIAKKGPVKAQHFAHASGRACAGALETALHKLAKQIIADELRLILPDVVAAYGDKRRTLWKSREVIFDQAVPEARELKQIVPDIVLWARERQLLVEVAVTHPCDEEKIEYLRERGMAAVEIDLSQVRRDAATVVVRDAVLASAPRNWLFHPERQTAISEMRATSDAKRVRAEQRAAREVQAFIDEYRTGLDAVLGTVTDPIPHTDELHIAELTPYVGVKIDGAGCFTWPLAAWQAAVLREFLVPRTLGSFATPPKLILQWFKEESIVRDKFRYVPPTIEQRLEEENIGFLSPYRAVEKYLDFLKARKVVWETQTSYVLADPFLERIRNVRAAMERKRVRVLDITSRVERIVSTIPADERGGITAVQLLERLQPEYGISFSDAIAADQPSYEEMDTSLRLIERMMFEDGPIVEADLGLPLAGERKRRQQARAAREEARRKAEERRVAVDRQARIQRLMTAVKDQLGSDDEGWATAVPLRSSGTTAMKLAELGEQDLQFALRELSKESDRRCKQRSREEEIDRHRGLLRTEAVKVFGEDVAAAVLASPYPELGRRRPLDFCVDAASLEKCKTLMQAIRRKLRSRR